MAVAAIILAEIGDDGAELREAHAPVEIRVEAHRIGQRIIACRQTGRPFLLLDGGHDAIAIAIGGRKSNRDPGIQFSIRNTPVAVPVERGQQAAAGFQLVGFEDRLVAIGLHLAGAGQAHQRVILGKSRLRAE